MGYLIKFGYIKQFESDAIVNSLGINGNVYGMLCEAILNAADSQELTSYIDSLVNNEIGTIFVTESGNLNCKNILHIVTPFRHMDDSNFSLLKKAYNDLLTKAIYLGHKSIVLPLIGSGANGYCLKDIDPITLSNVIKNVAKGACWIDSNVAHLALKFFPKPENSQIMTTIHTNDAKARLTERENEVLKLLVQGKSNTQIAQELIVSVHTAKAHVCSILQKLCVDDRVQAAVKAIKEGIVSV